MRGIGQLDKHLVRPRWETNQDDRFAAGIDEVPGQVIHCDVEMTNARVNIERAFAEYRRYLSAGGTDPYLPVPLADRVGYWIRPEVYHEAGVIEGESLWPAPRPPGSFHSADMFAFGKEWSNDQQFWWSADKTGESCELPLPFQKAGAYRFIVHATVGPKYGIFQINLNGKDLGQPIDFYDPALKTKDPIDLGVVTLPEGKPVLKISLTGANPSAKGSEFGLDYIKLVPAP